jgi:heat shock protein 4
MSSDDKYAHIPAHEKQDIVERCERAARWMDEQKAKQAALPKNQTPVLFCRDIKKEEEAVTYFVNPILNKPKPAPKPEEPAAPAADADTPMDDQQEPKKDDMDID